MKKKRQKKTWELTRYGKKWSQKEEDLLRELYPDKFNFELVEIFGRTVGGIYGKANHMRLVKNWRRLGTARFQNRKLWFKKEIKRLKTLFPMLPISQLRKHFPKRSAAAINKKALLLGLRKKYKTTVGPPAKAYLNVMRPEQKDLLVNLYPTASNKELAEMLGRTTFAIKTHAQKLGLHKACYVPHERSGRGVKLWTKEEDALIRTLYPTMQAKDIAAQLAERDSKSVQTRASFLGVKKDPAHKKPNNLWPDEDINKLRQLWEEGHSKAEIAEMIGRNPDCIKHQIYRQIRDFGLAKRPDRRQWSEEETDYLIQHYKNTPARQISNILGKCEDSIRRKAKSLHITKTKKNRWTVNEMEVLRQLWQQGYTSTQIAERIGKTISSTEGQLRRQKLNFVLEKRNRRRWSEEEIAYLVEHYEKISLRQLSDSLGRTVPLVRLKAQSLNLPKKKAPAFWTLEETDFLKKYYNTLSFEQIAEKLGNRTPAAVHAKTKKLGLRKETSWTAQEIDTLRKYYKTLPYKQIAEKLGNRTPDAVKGKALGLGLTKTL
jgi:hypothetical protein